MIFLIYFSNLHLLEKHFVSVCYIYQFIAFVRFINEDIVEVCIDKWISFYQYTLIEAFCFDVAK